MFLNQHKSIILSLIILAVASSFATADPLSYRSYFYNIYDIVLFSYEDGADIEVYRWGQLKYSGQLDKGQHARIQIQPPEPVIGVFEVRSSSKKISIISGDMIPRGLSGYYAMDPYGRGVSTELYTYVPVGSPDQHDIQKFVVFAYEDGTQVTVEYEDPNGIYREVITNLPLGESEYWENEDLSGKYVHVSANKSVSALSCYDSGYFVPSANGTFSGTRFYTYLGKNKESTGYSPQDLIVIAYNNDTEVTIDDYNDPGVEKWQGTLQADEVHVERFPDGLDEPLSITSSRNVTVCVDEWVTDESDSVQRALFAPAESGKGIAELGRDILVPVHHRGYLVIMANMDNTHVEVYNAETKILLEKITLVKGEDRPLSVDNGLWRIVSDRPLSVYTGERLLNQTFCSAEFCPLLFDITTGDMVKVAVRAGFANDCTEPEAPNHCFEPTDPNNNEICYTVAYWSDPNDDTDVVITDYLPREVEFISADPNTGFYDPNNHTYTWDIGTVTGGDPCSYCYIKVRVTEYAQPGQKIVNKVELASHTSYYTDEISTSICCPENPIIYVKADAKGFRNGTSWADAYTTLQPALTRARAGFGSEIWVAEGIYNPSKYIIRTPLSLLGGLEMYGGFAGYETSRYERDFVHNKTCLDGDIDEQGDNDSFCVVYAGRYISTDCVLDGFIIQGAVPSPYPWLFLNAGVICDYSMPTIRNCVIRKNSDHGIMCELASPRIYDCRIEENYGSGLYSAAGSYWTVAGRPIVKRCVIRENRVGLESLDNGRPIITNSWIYHNTKEGISLT